MGSDIVSGSIDDFAGSILLFERMELLLRKRLEVGGDNEAVLYQLATCQRQVGKIEDAVLTYARLHELYPNENYKYAILALTGGVSDERFSHLGGENISPLLECSNFLAEDAVEGIFKYMCDHQGDFRPAEVAQNGEARYDSAFRNNTDLDLKGNPIKKQVRKNLTERLPSIADNLGLESFHASKIEVKLRAYHDGEYFRVHQDGGEGRLISYVYFFHPEPIRYKGGDLVLIDTDIENSTYNSKFTRVRPKNNSVFFFPSNYYHAVLPVDTRDDDFLSSRFVINGHVWGEGE